MEFRTTQQNGILLSISDKKKNHGFFIEFHQGSVIIGTEKMRKNQKISSNIDDSKDIVSFKCNYWYKLSVNFLFEYQLLIIIVDGIDGRSLHNITLANTIEGPLYIGGLAGKIFTTALTTVNRLHL